MDEGTGTGQGGPEGWAALRLCNLVAQSSCPAEGGLPTGGGEGTDGEGNGTVGADLLQSLQEPDSGDRAGNRDGSPDARYGQIARLLSRDDLRRLPGRRALKQWQPGDSAQLDLTLLQILARRTAAGFPRTLA